MQLNLLSVCLYLSLTLALSRCIQVEHIYAVCGNIDGVPRVRRAAAVRGCDLVVLTMTDRCRNSHSELDLRSIATSKIFKTNRTLQGTALK